MDLNTLYHRTVESWADRVNAVGPDQWDEPTPCRDWTVRDLVNHVVRRGPVDRSRSWRGARSRTWATASTATCSGDDPIRSALAAASEATRPWPRPLPARRHRAPVLRRGADRGVRPPARRRPPGPRLGPRRGHRRRHAPGPGLVTEVAAWFADREELYRTAGAVGSADGVARRRPGRPAGRLRPGPRLGPQPRRAGAVLRGLRPRRRGRDHGADDRRLRLRGDRPGPRRCPARGRGSGPGACGRSCSAQTRDPAFTEEESFVSGDRGVLRWRFDWSDGAGAPGHVRGVDVLRFRDGKVAEKLSYVKG